jgi:hypothetical protein
VSRALGTVVKTVSVWGRNRLAVAAQGYRGGILADVPLRDSLILGPRGRTGVLFIVVIIVVHIKIIM